MRINLLTRTTIHALNTLYKKSKGALPLYISEKLNLNDLNLIAVKHRNQIYTTALYQFLCFNKLADDKFLKLLMEYSNFDSGVCTAIATSGFTSVSILNVLLEHKSKFVVEHAHLSLLSLQIYDLNDSQILAILDDFPDSDGIKYIIVTHQKVSKVILERLANDESEIIAEKAKQRIEKEYC